MVLPTYDQPYLEGPRESFGPEDAEGFRRVCEILQYYIGCDCWAFTLTRNGELFPIFDSITREQEGYRDPRVDIDEYIRRNYLLDHTRSFLHQYYWWAGDTTIVELYMFREGGWMMRLEMNRNETSHLTSWACQEFMANPNQSGDPATEENIG